MSYIKFVTQKWSRLPNNLKSKYKIMKLRHVCRIISIYTRFMSDYSIYVIGDFLFTLFRIYIHMSSTYCDGPLKYVDCGHEQKLLFCVVKLHVACPQYKKLKKKFINVNTHY